jgi:hypothetical protein
MRVTLNN